MHFFVPYQQMLLLVLLWVAGFPYYQVSAAAAWRSWIPTTTNSKQSAGSAAFGKPKHPPIKSLQIQRGGGGQEDAKEAATALADLDLKDCHVVTALENNDNDNSNTSDKRIPPQFHCWILPKDATTRQQKQVVHFAFSVVSEDDTSSESDHCHLASLYETLAWMSHVLVLPLTVGQPVPSLLLPALQRGLSRRVDRHVPSHVQVVLSSPLHDTTLSPSQLNDWKASLVLDHLSPLVESGVSTLEIVTSRPSRADIHQLLSTTDTTTTTTTSQSDLVSLDLPVHAFPLLLERVAQRLSKDPQTSWRLDVEVSVLNIPVGDDAPLSVPTVALSRSNPNSGGNALDSNGGDQTLPADSAPTAIAVSKDSSTHDRLEQEILEWAQTQLEAMQAQQEESWLQSVENQESDFAPAATLLLDELFVRLQSLPAPRRGVIQQEVGSSLQRLYQQHLQALRNQCGTQFDQVLRQLEEQEPNDNQSEMEEMNAATTQIVQHFRQQAAEAVPVLAQPGGVFRDMDLEYATELQGLLSDLQSSTELFLLDRVTDLRENEEEEEVPQKRRSRWYHKLGARLLVLSVNYVQGWLAWQGIQRAALEREKQFPKFPVF